MLLSLSSGALYLFPLATAARLARESGFDGIELVVSPEALVRGPAGVATLLRREGVPALSVHPPLHRIPGCHTELEQAAVLPRFCRALPGCRALVMHEPEAYHWHEPAAKRWLKALASACSALQGSEVRVGVENESGLAAHKAGWVLHSLPALRAFVEEHNLAVTYDTAHADSNGWDVVASLEAFRWRLVNVHLNDVVPLSPRARRLPALARSLLSHHRLPGEGILPLDAVLQTLARWGYDGVVTVELSPLLFPPWAPAQAVSRLRQCVARCRAVARV